MLRCIFLDNNIIAGLKKCIKTQIKVHGITFGDPFWGTQQKANKKNPSVQFIRDELRERLGEGDKDGRFIAD